MDVDGMSEVIPKTFLCETKSFHFAGASFSRQDVSPCFAYHLLLHRFVPVLLVV